MTKLRCSSCGGVYDAENYYHICPPEITVDIVEKATGKPLEGDPDPLKEYIGRRIKTLFPRDENVDVDGKPKKGKHRNKGGASKVG